MAPPKKRGRPPKNAPAHDPSADVSAATNRLVVDAIEAFRVGLKALAEASLLEDNEKFAAAFNRAQVGVVRMFNFVLEAALNYETSPLRRDLLKAKGEADKAADIDAALTIGETVKRLRDEIGLSEQVALDIVYKVFLDRVPPGGIGTSPIFGALASKVIATASNGTGTMPVPTFTVDC